MRLTFLGKESQPNQSPTLFATDRDSYVVQGWIVTDPAVLAGLDVGEDETVVEVPAKLLAHLAADGLLGEVGRVTAPIVAVTAEGNYIVQGAKVTDAATLADMRIPEHETCVEVPKSAVGALLIGG